MASYKSVAILLPVVGGYLATVHCTVISFGHHPAHHVTMRELRGNQGEIRNPLPEGRGLPRMAAAQFIGGVGHESTVHLA